MRVMVIEDDRKVASFIQTGLQQEGYAVDVLHEGSGAGEQARTVDYDAVVLDLMLPGRSGFQVLRDIRSRKADSASRPMPAIVPAAPFSTRTKSSKKRFSVCMISLQSEGDVGAGARRGKGRAIGIDLPDRKIEIRREA